jgi:hypothetical protein
MKRARAVLVIMLQILVLAGAVNLDVAEANPLVGYKGPPFPNIRIDSPVNQTVYTGSELLLDVVVLAIRGNYNGSLYETALWLNYSLDGVSYPFATLTVVEPSYPYYSYGCIHLAHISNGVHSLVVYGETTFGTPIRSWVGFWVYEGVPVPSPLPSPTLVLAPALAGHLTGAPMNQRTEVSAETALVMAILASVAIVSLELMAYFVKCNRKRRAV